MTEEFPTEYADTDDPNERYRLLRAEQARLRGAVDRDAACFDPDAVADTLADLNDELDGRLVAFVANDFGRPLAYRPAGVDAEAQRDVRRGLLVGKYERHDDLDALRERLLDAHPGIHKAIVAEHGPSRLRYHLPEGSSAETAFLTVREMVGLVDYTSNSVQREGLARTY